MAVVTSGQWRRCCELGGRVVAVETLDGAWVRPREPWGNELGQAADWWLARRMRAPSSPAGLIREAAPEWYRRLPWSCHAALVPLLAGGWQETEHVGVIAGPHRVYDLRRAYRWALTAAPLPDRRTFKLAERFDPWRTGLHAFQIDGTWPGAPWPLRDGGRVLVEAPADFERFGLPVGPLEWLGGVYWSGTVDGRPLAELVDSVPCAAVARAYWGPWAAVGAIRNRYRSGRMTELRPMTTNGVWAHAITARVRRRLADVQAPYRYVDSVIVAADRGPPTGDAVGDWRVVREYPDGVRIQWPGAYGPADGPPDKQAGIKRGVA